MKTRIAWAVMLSALAGCGGGGGEETPPPVPIVPSGQFDASFGTGGRVEFPIDGGMAVGPDDRVYVAELAIHKLDERGVPSVFFAQAPARFYKYPVLDEAGNLYAYGGTGGGIYKFHPDGRPSTAFGTNGFAALRPMTDAIFDVWDLVRDATDHLYLVGTRRFDTGAYGMVAKFDPQGRLVTSFGQLEGLLVFDMPGGRISTASAATIDAEGNLYVSGWAAEQEASALTLYVAKIDARGDFVRDFGSSGVWFSPHCYQANGPARLFIGVRGPTAVTLDATGDILMGGECTPPGSSGRPALFRLDPRGNVVSSFRDAGLRPDLFGGVEGESFSGPLTGLIVGRGGTIYAAGVRRSAATSCGDFAVAKLRSGGDPEPGFGSNGVLAFDVHADYSLEIAMDSHARLYLGALSHRGCPGGRPHGPFLSVYRLGS